jgi:hypothetical protein
MNGASITGEVLRQLCIYRWAIHKHQVQKWWEYVVAVDQQCDNFGHKGLSPACKDGQQQKQVMRTLKIEVDDIEQCEATHGEALLEEQLRDRHQESIFVMPTVVINDQQYRGNVDCTNPADLQRCSVLKAICAGFSNASKLPGICDLGTPKYAYSMSANQSSWYSASLACSERGGRLPKLTSLSSQQQVASACNQSEGCWTGLSKLGDLDALVDFQWSDGEAFLKHAASHAPAYAKFDHQYCQFFKCCISTSSEGKWKASDCKHKKSYMCQKELFFKYIYFGKPVNTRTAASECHRVGGDLAEIDSVRSAELVFSACRAEKCWAACPNSTQGTSCYIHGYTHPDMQLQRQVKWAAGTTKKSFVCQFAGDTANALEESNNVPRIPTRAIEATMRLIQPFKTAQLFPSGRLPLLSSSKRHTSKIIISKVVQAPSNTFGCSPFDFEKLAAISQSPILMVYGMGQCPVYSKVINAQNAGAQALIIVDDGAPLVDMESIPDEAIPFVVVSKTTGEVLLGNHTFVRLEWGGGNSSQPKNYSVPTTVKLELWVDAADTSTIHRVERSARLLADHVDVHVHFILIKGVAKGCHGKGELCETCVNHGRYCASSKFEVEETLRQLCILSLHSGDGLNRKWWAYVASMRKTSSIQLALKAANVSSAKIDQCYISSGGTTANATNSLLEEQVSLQLATAAFSSPTIQVNGRRFLGVLHDTGSADLDESGLVLTLCKKLGNVPDVCKTELAKIERQVLDYIPTFRQKPSLIIERPGVAAVPFSARLSRFGAPAYKGSVLGLMTRLTDAKFACAPFSLDADDSIEPAILLVDRGQCSFTTKVRHAQDAGAAAVIFLDNTADGIGEYEGESRLYETLIPSVLVSETTSSSLVGMLAGKHAPVQVRLSWSGPNPITKPKWELWTSSLWSLGKLRDQVGGNSETVTDLMETNFQPFAKLLSGTTSFSAHYAVSRGEVSGCRNASGEVKTQFCRRHCTNAGRYCLPHIEMMGLNGADILAENLRQRCVFLESSKANGSVLHWWKYVERFNARCVNLATPSGAYKMAHCVSNVSAAAADMRAAGISASAVESCCKAAGGTEFNAKNRIFEETVQAAADNKISDSEHSALTVNGVPFRGVLSCTDPYDLERCGPLAAICAGFGAGTALPAICSGGSEAYRHKYVQRNMTWDGARTECQQHGGTLAKIRSMRDNSRAYRACKSRECWIGLSRSGQLVLGSLTKFAAGAVVSHMRGGADKVLNHGGFHWDDNTRGSYRLWDTNWTQSAGLHDCVALQGREHRCSTTRVTTKEADVIVRHKAALESKNVSHKEEDLSEKIEGDLGPVAAVPGGGMAAMLAVMRDLPELMALGDDAKLLRKLAKEEEVTWREGATKAGCHWQHWSKWRGRQCSQVVPAVCEIPIGYRFVGHRKTWQDAEEYCVSHGGHLAGIESFGDNQKVSAACKDHACWIGLRQLTGGRTFKWAHSRTSFGKVSYDYQHWVHTGGVHGNGSLCAVVSNQSASWDLQRCGLNSSFVCEFSRPRKATRNATTPAIPEPSSTPTPPTSTTARDTQHPNAAPTEPPTSTATATASPTATAVADAVTTMTTAPLATANASNAASSVTGAAAVPTSQAPTATARAASTAAVAAAAVTPGRKREHSSHAQYLLIAPLLALAAVLIYGRRAMLQSSQAPAGTPSLVPHALI